MLVGAKSFAPARSLKEGEVDETEVDEAYSAGEGQRPVNKPAQGKRGTSAALGLKAVQPNQAPPGRNTGCARFGLVEESAKSRV
jgi:hypothetical protein